MDTKNHTSQYAKGHAEPKRQQLQAMAAAGANNKKQKQKA